jgi:hypothetical protein
MNSNLGAVKGSRYARGLAALRAHLVFPVTINYQCYFVILSA